MRTVVGVLRGGPSSEYEVSLKTGATILRELDTSLYEPRDLFIGRDGAWHLHGVPVAPERALHGVDVVWNALHGAFGEDGTAQRLLENLAIPYTGSGAIASATALHKYKTKDAVRALGIKLPHGVLVENTGDIGTLARKIFRTFPHPAIVKPVSLGSGLGILKAENYAELEYALAHAFAHAPQALVEEFISGRDASVGIIDHYRGEKTYALLPTPHDRLSAKEKEALVAAAKRIHKALGLQHYSQADFIVSKRGVYFLEINSQPKLHEDSKLMHGLTAVGAKLSDFIHHVLQLARAT